MHLMPPGLQPDRASPEEVQAVRNLLPSEFDRTHAVLSSACSDSKIWVIFHDLSVRPRVHEPVPSLRFSPSDSAVADLGTGKVTFLKPSDLQPMGHPIEPIGIWNEYLFACEFVRAGPGRGSPCITFVVIRNPAGRWGRVESLSGERFAVKGDWAFALLPASETYPWLHRARVAEVVKTVFPDNDGGTKGK
jgi:hypothetical protein